MTSIKRGNTLFLKPRTIIEMKVISALVLSAAFLGASVAASDETSSSTGETKIGVKRVEKSRWSGDFGVNVVTAYFAFGILQEDRGAIIEPYINLYHTLYEGNGFIDKATLGLQLWSSVHSRETGAGPSSRKRSWYEQDYYIPFSLTFAKHLTLTVSYLEYNSPNGAFKPQRSLNANAACDDTGWLGAFALHPHMTALYNFDGVVGVGRSDAWYFEIGIMPGFTVVKQRSYPVTVNFPLVIGFGDGHFYPGDAYGFFSASTSISVPLAFIPNSFGAWTGSAAFTYYNLGEATASLNSEHDHHAYVGQVGISFAF